MTLARISMSNALNYDVKKWQRMIYEFICNINTESCLGNIDDLCMHDLLYDLFYHIIL